MPFTFSTRTRLLAALTVAAVALPGLAHAGYWERRAVANDIADGFLGVVGAAAAADAEAKANARRCWTEERRTKVDRNRTVIKNVQVCE